MKKVLLIMAIMAIPLLFVSCKKADTQAFIDATTETTCLVISANDINDPELQAQAKEIYKKYGFDADDKVAMEDLKQQYKDDKSVQDAILKGLGECTETKNSKK